MHKYTSTYICDQCQRVAEGQPGKNWVFAVDYSTHGIGTELHFCSVHCAVGHFSIRSSELLEAEHTARLVKEAT